MAEIKFIDIWTHTAKVIRVNFFFIPRCGHSSEVHEIVFHYAVVESISFRSQVFFLQPH